MADLRTALGWMFMAIGMYQVGDWILHLIHG
jgi:hypothetical protein